MNSKATVFKNITLELLPTVANAIVQLDLTSRLWCFYGEMGAGKTTLIKTLCKQLGVEDEITSPSFSLVNEYRTNTGKTVYHFDFYRIRSIEEVYDIGYEDYFYSGNICLIEWPEKIEHLLDGENTFSITIEKTTEAERSIMVV